MAQIDKQMRNVARIFGSVEVLERTQVEVFKEKSEKLIPVMHFTETSVVRQEG